MITFFEHQDRARKKTGLLILVFGFAVIAIILAVYCAFYFFLTLSSERVPLRDEELFLFVSTITIGIISIGSLYKIILLRSGGGAGIAKSLGGRLLSSETRDPNERRVMNIVEEIAIASGVPVPQVYSMDAEEGINAFAAGFSPSDAVIGITAGSLSFFNRDELQGVVAHEFSHILNGDMRINLRLLGILNGILMISHAGRVLLRSMSRSRGKDKGAPAIAILGFSLTAIGSIGVLAGSIIQSAISRQREFLADASAVQFTRNPSGIANALRKIGGYYHGSKISHVNAREVSHFFFANGLGSSFFNLFATHPPLAERISRIDPSFDGTFTSPLPAADEQGGSSEELAGEKKHSRFVSMPQSSISAFSANPEAVIGEIGTPNTKHLSYAASLLHSLPEKIARAAHNSSGAQALIYSLLIDPNNSVTSDKQLGRLDKTISKTLYGDVLELLDSIKTLSPEYKLPLIDMALPALRGMSTAEYKSFISNIHYIVNTDAEVSLFEYALQLVISHHLAPIHDSPKRPRLFSTELPMEKVLSQAVALIRTLALMGNDDFDRGLSALSRGLKILAPHLSISASENTVPSLADLDMALASLQNTSPTAKEKIISACVATILADKQVSIKEAEILRAISAALDCPMPPILPSLSVS
ncbi:MAG: M48 family metallopeptidase [Deltaproteobacteria bacterium]|nr:M48 family metallopeptidase [Deltaproteobacteria bacterium]